MLIKTDFDNPLEEDIAFEDSGNTQSLEEVLKNSENILKSFLYLRRMFADTIFVDFVEYDKYFEEGQTEFTIEGIVFDKALIFIEGIKVNKSEYTLQEYLGNTIIKFLSPRSAGAWLNIVVLK